MHVQVDIKITMASFFTDNREKVNPLSLPQMLSLVSSKKPSSHSQVVVPEPLQDAPNTQVFVDSTLHPAPVFSTEIKIV